MNKNYNSNYNYTNLTEICQVDSAGDCSPLGSHQIHPRSPGHHHTPSKHQCTGCFHTETCLHGTGQLLKYSTSICFIPNTGMKKQIMDDLLFSYTGFLIFKSIYEYLILFLCNKKGNNDNTTPSGINASSYIHLTNNFQKHTNVWVFTLSYCTVKIIS